VTGVGRRVQKHVYRARLPKYRLSNYPIILIFFIILFFVVVVVVVVVRRVHLTAIQSIYVRIQKKEEKIPRLRVQRVRAIISDVVIYSLCATKPLPGQNIGSTRVRAPGLGRNCRTFLKSVASIRVFRRTVIVCVC